MAWTTERLDLSGERVAFGFEVMAESKEVEGPDGIRLESYIPSGAEEAEAPIPDALSCGYF